LRSAIVQIGEADEPLADVQHGDFVERASGFFAITRDERDRRAFGKHFGS